MFLFLAIDIGGTKTKYVVFDEQLRELEELDTVGFGLAVDSAEDIPKLREVLSYLAGKYCIQSVGINLGGKNKEQIRIIAESCFPGTPVCVCRESEGTASVAFGRSCRAQAVLLAGTGTIAIAFDEKGKQIISGGWGMNIGDGGSGYYIGLEAIKRSLQALDGTEPLTALQKEITGLEVPIAAVEDVSRICQLRDEVRGRIFPLERKRVAAFAKIVTEHCEAQETDALEIMADAGREMGHLAADCVKKLLPYEVTTLAVSGGLVQCKAYWAPEFEKTVKTLSSVQEFTYKTDGVLLGTKLLARKQSLDRGCGSGILVR